MPDASRESDDSLLRIVRAWPLAAGIAVAALGLLALLGWALDLQALKQPLPNLPAMKANTALGFLALGLALARAARRDRPDAVAIGLAIVPLTIGAATLLEFIAGVDLRIDELLVRDDVTALATAAPDRMSPLTAASFVVAAAALLAARRQGATAAGVREALSVASGLLAIFVLSAYAYGAEVLSAHTQMALHTAAAFLVTSAGLLLVGTEGPLGGLLRSRGTTGQVARRLLPASLIIPIAIGGVRIELQRQGYVDTQQGATLFAVAMVVVLSGASIIILARLRLLEGLRDAAFAAEREALARLQLASAEREAFFARNLDMMAIVGFDGRFRELNPAWQTTLGHPLPDLLGRPFLDLVHPEDLDRTRAEAGRLSATGQPLPFENRYRRADGTYAWMRWTSTTSQDLQVFLATARDITQEREAEAHLRESEERFRLLFESNPAAVAIKRADGNGYIDVNPAFERLVGRTRMQLLDPAFDHASIWTDPKMHATLLERARAVGNAKDLELDVQRPDGRVLTTLGAVQHLEVGGVPSFLLALQDVTEARDAQAAAQRATERFERVFRLSPVPIALSKEDGTFLEANDAFCDLVGRPADDLMSGRVKAPEVWEDPQERQRMLVSIRQRGLIRDLELRIKRPTGEVRTTLASLEFLDLGGNTSILSLLQDITDRMRMQEEREARISSEVELERLRRTDAFRSEFINNITHELATPLTPLVLKMKTLLADKTFTAAQRQSFESLERNITRLRHLVQDLMGAADLQARNLAIERRRLNLTRELRAAVAAHHPAAARAGLVMDEPEDTGLTVSADSARLQLVLGHLLGNAIKFTPSGGKVIVASRREDDQVRVVIADTGIGLTSKQMEGLWRPFSQAHDKSQRTDSGSGLGLYVVKGIIELHGGEVGCSSPGPGQGSKFWFTLPLATGHLDPLAKVVKAPKPPAEPKRRLNPGVEDD
ncbi:MAG: PAS domain S-box protein [Candidatus Thermoplasmatota archaeon]